MIIFNHEEPNEPNESTQPEEDLDENKEIPKEESADEELAEV